MNKLWQPPKKQLWTPPPECSRTALGSFVAGGGGAGGYTTRGIVFNGTNYMTGTTNTPFTGAVDSKKGTVSCWLKFTNVAGDGVFNIVFETANQHGLNLARNNSDFFNITVYTASVTVVIDVAPNKLFKAGSGWHHVLVSWDTTSGISIAHVIIDGVHLAGGFAVPAGPYVVNTDAIADNDSASTIMIGARGGGSLPFYGEMADFAYWIDEYIDLTNATNRLKFIDANGKPADLGLTGQLPFGVGHEPELLLRASAFHGETVANFHVNKGTGGNLFSVTGTFTQASTSPSDTYTTLAAAFDGTDYAIGPATTAYSGAADGKKGTVSLWFRVNGGDGTDRMFYTNNLGRGFQIYHSSANTIRVMATGSDTIAKAQFTSVSTFLAGPTWHHLVASWDVLTTAGWGDMWIDGVQDRVVNSLTDADINYAAASTQAIGSSFGSANANHDIADFAFWPDRVLRLDQAGVVNLFRTINGKPVDFGSSGLRPVGVPPIFMFRVSDFYSETIANFYVNKGSGGLTFTPTGTLTQAATSPSS